MNRAAACAVVLAMAALNAAQAQSFNEALPDPTRPTAYHGGDSTPVSTGPMLQSIISSGGQRSAIISGQTLRVGERFGDAKVVAIDETQVTLAHAGQLQVLKLYAGFDKRPAANPAEAQGKNREAKKKAEK